MKILFSLLVLMATTTNAQDLSKHQWEDRVLLVFTNNTLQDDFKRQIFELRNYKSGLEERKLSVYQVTPKNFRRGLSEKSEWTENTEFYKKYKSKDAPYEVVLIGLDGGKKLTATKFLPPEKLFVVIDGMPMRKAEIKNKNQ